MNTINYSAHRNGAMLAALGTGTLAVLGHQVRLSATALAQFLENPWQDGDIRTLLLAMILAGAMALFPDLDTESRPRKYFHRAAFGAMAGLLLMNQLEVVTLLALGVMAPMLHKHRGWTHHWLTPWIFAILFAACWEYARAENAWFSGFSWKNVWQFLFTRWIFPTAMVLGHYTHLLLDSRLVAKMLRKPA